MEAWAEQVADTLALPELVLLFKGTVLLRPPLLAGPLARGVALLGSCAGDCRYIAGTRASLQGLPLDAPMASLASRLLERAGTERLELGPDEVAPSQAPIGQLVLGDKARTVELLSELTASPFTVAPPRALTLTAWASDPGGTLEGLRVHFGGARVVVRSSTTQEDAWAESNAGRFLSVLDVDSADAGALGAAISAVFASYGEAGPGERVFLQRYVSEVEESGVLMTRHPETLAPYFVLATDRQGGRTDRITSGSAERASCAYVGHGASLATLAPGQRRAVEVGVDLVRLLGTDALDVEYAVTRERFHVFQVRPIAAGARAAHPAGASLRDRLLVEARARHHALHARQGGAVGEGPIYSSMADWNPAEMIGRLPAPLARSLYGRLITDRVWAAQRAAYGYRDLRGTPLLQDFAGHAYVDVRASLSSFIPARTPEPVAHTLVSMQLARLAARPELHDKIEFEIAHSCASLGLGRRLDERYGGAVDRVELHRLTAALVDITHRGIEGLPEQLGFIEQLRSSRPLTLPQDGLGPLLTRLASLGTLPFAHLARTAFVVTELLRSFVREGALAEQEQQEILERIRTVAGQLLLDAYRVRTGELSFAALVAEFGHLRPGTYDVRVPRYDAEPERYFGPLIASSRAPAAGNRALPQATVDRLDDALQSSGLSLSSADFLRALSDAISGREYGKHIFTRTLSDLLEQLARWGAGLGLDREEVSLLTLEDVQDALGRPAAEARARCREAVAVHRELNAAAHLIELPDVIGRTAHLFSHESGAEQPLFVTRACVRAPVLYARELPDPSEVRDAIILLERADPGYDGLLALGVAGIVTAYGGANSHMAVRCTELQIPAAIGVGREELRRLAAARAVTLDCEGRRLLRE